MAIDLHFFCFVLSMKLCIFHKDKNKAEQIGETHLVAINYNTIHLYIYYYYY